MRKATTEILILTILWIIAIISIARNPQFRPQFIFGLISLTSISIALILRKKDLSLGILAFTLFLSIFDAIKFSEAFAGHIGFVSLIPFVLLLFLVFSRLPELLILKDNWFGDEPKEVEKGKENKVAIFKREFQKLSSEELLKKINNDKIVEEAKIAVEEILTERNVKTE
jgi:signal transduction histidine kinase